MSDPIIEIINPIFLAFSLNQSPLFPNIPKYLNEKGFPLQCETKWNSYYLNILCCAVLCLVAQLCPTLCNPVDYSLPASSIHGDSPDKNTGVGCHNLLQGIFPTQGSNPGLWHCRCTLGSKGWTYHPGLANGHILESLQF